jgi:hypothetical protein
VIFLSEVVNHGTTWPEAFLVVGALFAFAWWMKD